MPKARLLEIVAFLEKAKSLIGKGQFEFVPRRKNIQFLADMGLTILDAREEILSLDASDYLRGPSADYDAEGFLWEFLTDIDGKKVYIKMKIDSACGHNILKCVSFHESNDGRRT